jgi:hypothetical protein
MLLVHFLRYNKGNKASHKNFTFRLSGGMTHVRRNKVTVRRGIGWFYAGYD